MADAAHVVVVDIASLAAQLRAELVAADAAAAGQVARGCPIVIAMADELTRNVDLDEYVPHHVSIGPYYHHIPRLARDDEKVQCLRAVLSAAAISGTTLEVYLEELARLEARARSCYAHPFEGMDAAAFVRMLLLDACYVLVHLAGVVEAAAARRMNGGVRVEAPSAGGHMMAGVAVVRDVLYLAENQIPFFAIDKVYKLTFPDAGDSAAEAIAGYVQKLLRRHEYSFARPAVPRPDELGNLLHLLHMHFTPTSPPSPPATGSGSELTGGGKRRPVGRWRTATEYHYAGVGFKARQLGRNRKGAARSILDVKLQGRSLEIPRLNIDAETWRLLRNLMALEQSNPAGSHVTAYCVFVSQLACTPWDVELLSRRGVISHGLGSDGEVAELFADLCKGVAFRADDQERNYLHGTWQALEGRFRCRPRRWAAWLMLRYFSNPWVAVGLAAAAVGLVCTVVQAVYSVLSYGH